VALSTPSTAPSTNARRMFVSRGRARGRPGRAHRRDVQNSEVGVQTGRGALHVVALPAP